MSDNNTLWLTDRLKIRNWNPEQDAIQAFEIYGDPQVMRFIRPPETSVGAVRSRLQELLNRYRQRNNGTGFWAVLEKETARIVGTILLSQLPDNYGVPTEDYEISWHFRRESWGKGYAT